MGREPRAAGQAVTMLAADGPNSVAVATGLVGDEWTLWIVARALEQGLTRYSDWLAAGPISSSVLMSRLARLVEAEVFERELNRYHLTQRGRQLWPLLLAIGAWERRWAMAGNDPPPTRHTECGNVFAPVLVCAACDRPTGSRDVTSDWGRSGSWSRTIPVTATRRRTRDGVRAAELVRETMELLGSRWSATLLGAVFRGASRFGEFEQYMGAPPLVISERLRTFCTLGVLVAVTAPDRQRTDYRLTDKGRSFYPVVALLLDWGARWFHSPDGPAVVFVHVCGEPFHPRLVCDQCGRHLRGSHVQPVRSPGEG
ncbi:MAG: winged helix-turn-helix transcriptional regulator [Jatrophihabitantaceae bacterium]